MNINKKTIITIAIIVALVILAFILRGSNNTWVCKDGQWIKRGNPSEPMPTKPCIKGQADKSNLIKVKNIQPNQVVESPIVIEGEARGYWFFEADFPVRLINKDGKEIARTAAITKSDWMTEDFIPFKATLYLDNNLAGEFELVLEKDNPSGLLENADELRIPINIKPSLETIELKVYFNNSRLDPEMSCDKVFPVIREVPKTQEVARAALTELLKGTMSMEEDGDFSTSINQGVKIQSLTIENGVAKVDFDDQLEFQVGGSCRVSAIRAQITETLKQFPTVDNVIISINGRTEDILQP